MVLEIVGVFFGALSFVWIVLIHCKQSKEAEACRLAADLSLVVRIRAIVRKKIQVEDGVPRENPIEIGQDTAKLLRGLTFQLASREAETLKGIVLNFIGRDGLPPPTSFAERNRIKDCLSGFVLDHGEPSKAGVSRPWGFLKRAVSWDCRRM
mgnify:FL=1